MLTKSILTPTCGPFNKGRIANLKCSKLTLFFFVILFSITINSFAQVPGGINYQGIARNEYFIAYDNKIIALRFTIRQSSPTGPSLYSEVKEATTDSFGVFNVVVGAPGGLSQSGNIREVPWGEPTSKYLQVEMTVNYTPGFPPSFINMGATQLLSVPFSFYSDISDSAKHALKSDSTKHAQRSDSAKYAEKSGKYFFSATIPYNTFQSVPENSNFSYKMKFTRALINEGNAYDSLTSTFIAPDSGVYNFNVHIYEIEEGGLQIFDSLSSYGTLKYAIAKNNKIVKMFAGGLYDIDLISTHLMIALVPGDQISVRIFAHYENVTPTSLGWTADTINNDFSQLLTDYEPSFFAEFSGYKIK